MQRLRLPLAALAGLAALAPPLWADDAFDQLMRELQAAQQSWSEQIQKAQAASQPVAYDQLPPHPALEFAPRFRAYAQKMSGKPEAVPALIWIVNAPLSRAAGQPSPDQSWALEHLAAEHVTDAELSDSLGQLQYAGWTVGRAPLIAFYEQIIARNKHDEARARAMFNLAFLLNNPQEMRSTAVDETVRAADTKRASELFRKIAQDFPKTRTAAAAEGYVYEMDHLQVGMPAPDLEGLDADEKKVLLSQFKGQVVVLDFWGFW